ncbi:hypothetical protein A3A03_03990 [Candidatus Nomurabacteria bacterium RIFCSPLOWO2_01_FULL_40_18]|uniref:Uncharacterized protein n=1 Tax=Candidatus Nomurabacteria bacterium RIFCSPLOWO2_01_FULL_40_18 TaxID=1801773 RepID=A0A1F6XJX6_9BACT|nr:MAG: hypothetical protein A3A03_03990 [Candidatus Nomurabacteria bacterium RIFCSPLOWO2_01_FULL_40_18]
MLTIPKNFLKDDLVIIPRKQYESLLRGSKNIFLKSYSKSDTIYEERDTDEAIAIYKKEKKQGKLKVLKSLSSLR